MVKIENSKRTILNLAESLLQDMGYNGFSYAHIASELGVKNAAIHYHFPTKEDLSVAVIQRYRDRFKLWINNARVKDLAPEEKLDWFFSIYTSMRADKGKVCLVGSMEAEFNSIPEGLQGEVQSLHREMLAWLQTTLAEGREAGVFQFNGEPANKAALIMSTLQGGLQMARALGTKKFRDVIDQIRLDLLV
ncbi:MAG: TetR/AcrR family transcriptional regulator [Anaerolineales bacterium]|nr:TetR/AcrR family transcriptional regulator [Anaerolineae bacterium]PWB73703.1 MAG: TetR/AcrR family transcriptional regulator [Anaerolineales bacterium]